MTLNEIPYSVLQIFVDQGRTIVSYLCGNSIPKLNTTEGTDLGMLPQTKTFPVTSSWQSTECRMLSTCTYNFAVACNVSLFSGWENDEFTMKVLKKRHGQNRHFGVHIRDKRLTGHLPTTVEDELNRQWEAWAKIQPTFPRLDFSAKMKAVKRSEWFQSESRSRERFLRNGSIACYAEEEALELFLCFAALCSNLSRTETDTRISTRYQQFALSILLPLVSAIEMVLPQKMPIVSRFSSLSF